MTGANKQTLSLQVVTVILLFFVASCSNKGNFLFNEAFPEEGWSKFHKPAFTASIGDTLSAYDISVSLRNTHEYPFRNIFLFITTTSPTGLSIKDTIEYQLANEKGKWYGKGLGDLHNVTLAFKTNIIFPESGDFSFKIEQGMRKDLLPGILDVGLIIKQKH